MISTLVKGLSAFVSVCVLSGGSLFLQFRVKSAWCMLQLLEPKAL